MTRFAQGTFIALAAMLAASCNGGAVAAPSTLPTATSQATTLRSPAPSVASWRASTSPTGRRDGAQWITITSFDGAPLSAAVFAPPGDGPAPVVIYLYFNQTDFATNYGLLQRDMDFAAALAREGFVTVVLCWQISADDFCGRNVPRSGAQVLKDLTIVASAARTLPRARADRVVLVGRSAGGAAALLAASNGSDVSAVVSISTPYEDAVPQTARYGKSVWGEVDGLSVPVLIVYGTMDSWSTVSSVGSARRYAEMARGKGKTVETIIVDGADDLLAFSPTYWTRDLMNKVVGFIRN